MAAITSRPRHFQYHRSIDQLSLYFHHYRKSVNMDMVSCPTHKTAPCQHSSIAQNRSNTIREGDFKRQNSGTAQASKRIGIMD